MGVYNMPPFLGTVRNVDTDPDENVDGDLLRWNASDRLWKRINETALPAGTHNHDDRYFREDEYLDSSAGSSDAGKPIKLSSSGRLPQSMRHPLDVKTKTASYAMGINDEMILADASAGIMTITLPPIVSVIIGLVYHVKRINTNDNSVTIIGTVN